MSKQNVTTAECDAVEYKGEYALIYEGRLDKSTVPDGFHAYDLRHKDNDWGAPATIEKSVVVNFFGSIILNHPLEIPESGLLKVGRNDINRLGYSATLSDPWESTEPVMEPRMGG